MALRSYALPAGLFLLGAFFCGAAEAASDKTPAKELFGKKTTAADLTPAAVGSYARGCLAGAAMLPVDGPYWQVMRLSRNRNWGHPELVAYLQDLAEKAVRASGWPGLLIGDLAQPRGGPMLTGHASHQIGLDADIWLNPAPKRTLTRFERENISAKSMLAADKISIDKKIWTKGHFKVIRAAATDARVARIFVHPAIKRALCDAAGSDRDWLRKVRPWWGHHYHFHVRLDCPSSSSECTPQKPPPPGDGCGKEVDDWLKMVKPRKPVKPKNPPKKKWPLTLAQLPQGCRDVLQAGDVGIAAGSGGGAVRSSLVPSGDDIPHPKPSPRRAAAEPTTPN
ncbi:MAG: penicillin-insensitive murein endopeptidase [Hyphomicrobiales bacterium]|nr:penicillin-insensitive murein endopeptidase [Hyphomicrobiales bacterium]